MDAKTFKRRRVSRISYFAFSVFTYLPALLVSDVFLVDLLQYAGFDDGAIGIVSSSAYFVALAQLLVLFCGHKIRKPKLIITFGYVNFVTMFALVHILALTPIDTQLKQILIVVCLLLGRLTSNFACPFLDACKFSFVSYNERATFTATNNIISLAASLVFTLAMGYTRDYYRASGNILQGLQISAIIILIFSALTLASTLLMDFSKAPATFAPTAGIKDILRNTFGTKSFLYLLLFYLLLSIANCITTGFWGVYKTKELNFSVGTLQVVNMVSNVATMLLLRPISRFADRRSYLKCVQIFLVGVFLSFVLGALTTPECAWLAVVFTILYSFSCSVVTNLFFNMLLDYIHASYYMYSTAMISCISGLCGFGISFAAAWLLEWIQSNGNTLFGMTVYAQQILSAISALIVIVLWLFAKFILGRLPKQQLTDGGE